MKAVESNRQKVYAAVVQFLQHDGLSPTVRELCAMTGISSTSCVYRHLMALRDEGKLVVDLGKNRSIRLADRPTSRFAPLLGQVPAGVPVLAEENWTQTVAVPDLLAPDNDDHFVLQVKGDSMIEAGLYEGDWLVVRRHDTARNGQIVVALADDEQTEATVKTLSTTGTDEHGQKIATLLPANPNYAPIPAPNLRILGIVTGLMRRLPG